MDKIRYWILILWAASGAHGQDGSSILSADSTLSEGDSLSIFRLIDSLLSVDEKTGSQLAVRLSYNSNVLSAGRTLGIENFGLAPGITYYHQTGLYADVTSYWSRDFTPTYYLTVTSVGYMKAWTKRFSLMAAYDRYFYHFGNDAYIPYENAITFTPILELKPLSFIANYAFYFGDDYAHRVMPGISVRLEKKKIWNLDRLAILPSFFALWGNETITTLELVPSRSLAEARKNFLLFGSYRYGIVEHSKDVFGIMNYAISIPLSASYKKWGLSVTYTYNIPRPLKGEPDVLSESTYLSGSLLYLVDLRRNKNSL
jgi:hypothetical protein